MRLNNKLHIEPIEFRAYKNLVSSKFESDEYKEWLLFKDEISARFQLLNDTTASNAALTLLYPLSKTLNGCIIGSLLTIHRSLYGPYFTMYMKNRVRISAGDGLFYDYPYVVVFEPLGEERRIFKELGHLIQKRFDLTFIKGRYLGRKVTLEDYKQLSVFELLFGYEGNLLERHQTVGNLSFDPTRD